MFVCMCVHVVLGIDLEDLAGKVVLEPQRFMLTIDLVVTLHESISFPAEETLHSFSVASLRCMHQRSYTSGPIGNKISVT